MIFAAFWALPATAMPQNAMASNISFIRAHLFFNGRIEQRGSSRCAPELVKLGFISNFILRRPGTGFPVQNGQLFLTSLVGIRLTPLSDGLLDCYRYPPAPGIGIRVIGRHRVAF